MASLSLVEPSERFASSLLAMAEDYRQAGEQRYCDVPELARGDAAAYLRILQDRTWDDPQDATRVPVTTFWLVEGDRIIGASRLRPRLTPALEEWGGHIAYDVRPSERRKGYGTILLALTLQRASLAGLKSVLLMCWQDNAASIRVMERNRARQLGVGYRDGRPFLRFAIGCQAIRQAD